MTIQVGESVSGRFHSGGVSLRTVQLWGASSDGKIPFSLMKKREIFIICKGKCLRKEHKGMVLGGAMVTGGA
jgi:hypothetical protein